MREVSVVLTGGAGRIAYALIPFLFDGSIFGLEYCVDLRLLDLPGSERRLEGISKEVRDCCFPLLSKITCTINTREAFSNTEVAILVGGFPRQSGMERSDLIARNVSNSMSTLILRIPLH